MPASQDSTGTGLAERLRKQGCQRYQLPAALRPSALTSMIGFIVGRSSDAARQLASRARRRVQGAATTDTDLASQRAVVDAFFASARDGDFDALVAVLDRNVVLRSDGGALRPGSTFVSHGAHAVASSALTYSRLSPFVRPAIVNGVAGVVVAPQGRQSRSWPSPCATRRSSRSTLSPIPNASPNSTSRNYSLHVYSEV